MKLIKLIPAVALTLGLAFASYAENKNEAKTEEPAKTEATSRLSFEYYVTGEQMIDGELHYNVTTNPQTACGSGTAKPCKVTSSEEADANNQISENDIESVDQWRNNY